METLKSVMQSVLEQAASVLADLKTGSKSQHKAEQMEFPFGMVSEFDFNASVRRKTGDRS